MPWRERSPMDERVQFISDYQRQLWTITELCERYGVSRKTGYKWIARYQAMGATGLGVRSSRPQHSPQATNQAIVAAILALRHRYPRWGAKKILAVLREREPAWALPAISTGNDILRRGGLVTPRRRRRPVTHPGYTVRAVTAPNVVWSADFKGQFRTQDAQLCYPLTICDVASRYVLTCHGLCAPTTDGAIAIFRRAFARYGLPERIRTDNGEPFAAASLGRLSRLSVWWIRLGIRPERIRPGRPDQNGRHERALRRVCPKHGPIITPGAALCKRPPEETGAFNTRRESTIS